MHEDSYELYNHEQNCLRINGNQQESIKNHQESKTQFKSLKN